MKKIIAIAMTILSLCSCKQEGYVIVGNIKNLDEGCVNLLDASGSVLASDECVDGKFTLTGKVDVPCLAYVNNGLGVTYAIDIPLMLENTKIRVSGDASTQNIGISGSKTNEAMVEYKYKRDLLAPDDAAGYLALLKDTFEANSDNLLGALMISNLYGYVSSEELLAYCDRLPQEYLQDKMVSHYRDVAYARVNSAVGKPFIDASLHDVDGKLVSLADCVKSHKATVVLFWAHWARNVDTIVPEIVSLCKKYEKQGLYLYSIALDGNKDRTLESMAKFQLPGSRILEDSEHTDKISNQYGIDGAPRVVVIDQEGTIVARGTTASDIETKLKEIFENK